MLLDIVVGNLADLPFAAPLHLVNVPLGALKSTAASLSNAAGLSTHTQKSSTTTGGCLTEGPALESCSRHAAGASQSAQVTPSPI
jgi:hypothetical protein